ncbi:hypothetical protein FS837_001912 [Tulasnella sp. UAMH 9824]|nr:hypothetical protein FS837_001912 [Tulasnella sp. UAMH 9824]
MLSRRHNWRHHRIIGNRGRRNKVQNRARTLVLPIRRDLVLPILGESRGLSQLNDTQQGVGDVELSALVERNGDGGGNVDEIADLDQRWVESCKTRSFEGGPKYGKRLGDRPLRGDFLKKMICVENVGDRTKYATLKRANEEGPPTVQYGTHPLKDPMLELQNRILGCWKVPYSRVGCNLRSLTNEMADALAEVIERGQRVEPGLNVRILAAKRNAFNGFGARCSIRTSMSQRSDDFALDPKDQLAGTGWMVGDPSDKKRTLPIAWGLETMEAEEVGDERLESQRDKLPGGHTVDWRDVGNRRIALDGKNRTRADVGVMI